MAEHSEQEIPRLFYLGAEQRYGLSERLIDGFVEAYDVVQLSGRAGSVRGTGTVRAGAVCQFGSALIVNSSIGCGTLYPVMSPARRWTDFVSCRMDDSR